MLAGIGAAGGLSWLMTALLFGVSPLDPLTHAAVPLILVIAAGSAAYLPGAACGGGGPVETLRAE
jgi:hypothetical protein